MATYHELPTPPKPKGTAEEYNQQLYNYLYRLKEQMQAIVNGLAEQQTVHNADQEGGRRNGWL